MVRADLPTVVIVDDSPEVRALVRSQIRLSGRLDVVGEGSNGLDAAALANRLHPDLMLLDVSMPVIDGLAALPHVREVSPATQVVMYSGFDETGLAGHAKELGASAFVEKSVPFEVLLDALLGAVRETGDTAAPAPADVRPAPTDPVLEEHLERFREVFEDAAIGMATMTLSGRVVRANRSLGALLGRPLDSLVGVALADLATDADAVREAFERVEAGEPIVTVTHGVAGRDLQVFRSTLSPVIDARGRPLYLFLQVQDVTRQEAAEQELRRTEARFKLFVDAVEDYAIFLLDPTGRITSWNAGAQRLKGWRAHEILGRHIRTFYPPEVAESGHPEHELDHAKAHGSYEEEGWRLRKDGSRFWAHVTITAIREPDGTLAGFTKVTRDTTQRRQMLQDQERAARELADANHRLAEANAQLEEANRRLAAVAEEQAQFFAVTAHELRAPVSVLSGASATLAAHYELLEPDERTEITAAVGRSSQQLRRLLDDLLTAARLQARRLQLDLQPVDLEDVVRTAVTAARQSNRDIEIRTELEPGVTVEADPGRLVQVVDNLVTNAVQHGRGPVDVAMTVRPAVVEVSVRDAGGGVPADLRDRLFEQFSTSSSRGTGLGLFLVRELARAHGGDAWYRPDDHAFVVSLPRGVA